ncbi:Asp/Glu racemase [Chromatiales bacterium (ex Bugula neritina AB1)]|nr:Asp/Glu racemase [Chromatiales bacterium (ex Bugula neritina AB1)]
MKKILVINPNSNEAVTQGLRECLAPLQIPGLVETECMTLAEGPFGIESRLDSESVVLPLRRVVLEREDADAYVIACYSDPGLALCREATEKPVFGIQESGLFSALQRGERVGVVALGLKSIARHLPYIRALGLESRLAAERPLHLSVAQSEEAAAYPRIEEVARALVEQDMADTILVGCAGLARHCEALENALGIPVTEPTQAAVSQALGAVLLR